MCVPGGGVVTSFLLSLLSPFDHGFSKSVQKKKKTTKKCAVTNALHDFFFLTSWKSWVEGEGRDLNFDTAESVELSRRKESARRFVFAFAFFLVKKQT